MPYLFSGMAAESRTYEFVDHTADIIVRAIGSTLAEAFAAAGEALFDIITDSAEIEGTESLQFEIESIDLEGLLITFLSELIVIHETQNIVLSGFSVTIDNHRRLLCAAKSEPFDPHRHGEGTPVKGISYHELKIERRRDGKHVVEVLFDI